MRPFLRWSQGPASHASPTNVRQAKGCARCGPNTHLTGGGSCSSCCMLCSRAGHRQKRGRWPFRRCGKCKAENVSALGDDSHDAEQTTRMPECAHLTMTATQAVPSKRGLPVRADGICVRGSRASVPWIVGLLVALTPAAAHGPTRAKALHSQRQNNGALALLVGPLD